MDSSFFVDVFRGREVINEKNDTDSTDGYCKVWKMTIVEKVSICDNDVDTTPKWKDTRHLCWI